MRIAARVNEAFAENPIVWILFALLLLSTYGNYRNGSHLSLVCSDIQDMMREPPFRSEALAIWQKAELREIETICSTRDVAPDD